MNLISNGRRVAALLLTTLLAGPAAAQDYGDTPYVQTPQNVVDKMLEVAKVGAKDYVIDLGSGDGRMVITAAQRYGARGFGVDLDKRLVTLSNRNAAKGGVADRAAFFERDIYETDLSPASVVTIYLLPEVNLMMRPKLFAMLKPGTRVVAHDYDMGEWAPDLALTIDAPNKPVGRDKKSKIFYWVVPAKAAGKWRWRSTDGGVQRDFDLSLNQNFQKIEGTVTSDGKAFPIEDAKLVGDAITFVAKLDPSGAARQEFSGRIINHAIEGAVRTTRAGAPAQQAAWSAARTETWEPRHLTLPPPTLIPPQPQ
ncbi:MAG TPA: class I SAM-dependent methyltransferase [Burkholderiales bacterium]|nr:class I SAM-dependent methyltransferase [Burkholderiales bacterium]